MATFLWIIASLTVGFIAGALTFRNNAAKANKAISDSEALLAADKEKAKFLLNSLKNNK